MGGREARISRDDTSISSHLLSTDTRDKFSSPIEAPATHYHSFSAADLEEGAPKAPSAPHRASPIGLIVLFRHKAHYGCIGIPHIRTFRIDLFGHPFAMVTCRNECFCVSCCQARFATGEKSTRRRIGGILGRWFERRCSLTRLCGA